MPLFDEKISNQLRSILNQMQNNVKLVLFTQEIECATCKAAHQMVEEIASLSSKLSLDVYSLVLNSDKAEQYKVDKVPAILLLDQDGNDTRMKFYGIPGGYEINSFLGAILTVSGKRDVIPKEISERIAKIDKDIHMEVFVSLECPHCPTAVMAAHLLALENPHIHADMIESSSFIPLSIANNISSVPKTIINGKMDFIGAQPVDMMLDMLEKV